jgi:hypothetical protein
VEHTNYEWICNISITKLWDAKFVMGQEQIHVLLRDISLAPPKKV